MARIQIPALLSLLGERNTVRLCVLFGGQTLPTKDIVKRYLRDFYLTQEYLAGSAPADLSLKYRLSIKETRRLIAVELRRRREREIANDRANTKTG